MICWQCRYPVEPPAPYAASEAKQGLQRNAIVSCLNCKAAYRVSIELIRPSMFNEARLSQIVNKHRG